MYRYGITIEGYSVMYDAQQGLCAICNTHKKTLCVDHDHATGQIRGLLCSTCNLHVGRVEISGVSKMKNLYEKILEYIQYHAATPHEASSPD